MKVELSFGLERKDRWSVRITHDRRSVVLVPEGVTQTQANGPMQIVVQTTGIDHFVVER